MSYLPPEKVKIYCRGSGWEAKGKCEKKGREGSVQEVYVDCGGGDGKERDEERIRAVWGAS